MNRKFLMRVTKMIVSTALGCAFAFTMLVGGKVSVNAQGLTQTTDASKVPYSTVSASDIELLKTIFDFDYYKAQNPELVSRLGDNYNALFEHFYKYGLFEGRTCNASFDPAAYASAYSDLKEAFGTNILSYYKHYVTEGKNDPNRQITTLKACAYNGITVQSLSDSEIKITPQLYQVAEKFGTTNYAAVSSVVERAIVEAAAVGGTAVISNGEESVVISDTSDNNSNDNNAAQDNANQAVNNAEQNNNNADSADDAGNNENVNNGDNDNRNNGAMSGLTVVKSLSIGEGFDITIFRGNNGGYGAWDSNAWMWSENARLLAHTDDYTYTEPTREVIEVGDDSYDVWDTEGVGTQVAYIPVYVGEANNYDELYEDGIAAINTGEEDQGVVPDRETNGEDVHIQNEYSDYHILVDNDSNAETTYDVGVAFGESSDEGFRFSVGVEGDDGFELRDDYELSGEPAELE